MGHCALGALAKDGGGEAHLGNKHGEKLLDLEELDADAEGEQRLRRPVGTHQGPVIEVAERGTDVARAIPRPLAREDRLNLCAHAGAMGWAHRTRREYQLLRKWVSVGRCGVHVIVFLVRDDITSACAFATRVSPARKR